jgi:NTP-dependent ternary system trypsin peptidase co-occuring protein
VSFVEVPLGQGEALIVQVDDDAGGLVRAGRLDEVTATATETFESALGRLKGAAQAVVTRMRTLAEPPDEVTVDFSVKLGTQLGVVIANSSAEANLRVSLRWVGTAMAPAPEAMDESQPTAGPSIAGG